MEQTIRKEATVGYSIGDTAKICEVPVHTIRFWEKEFGSYITPDRTVGKQRRYSEDSIRRLMRIRQLLWIDGYSIHGAKRVLSMADGLPLSGIGIVPNAHDLAITIARFVQEQLTMTHTGAQPTRTVA
jgi:DNA-binding transcriptional MerR regulator